MTCPSCAAETGSSSVCAACGAALDTAGLAPGTVVAGRYEVQGRLGVGGMGVVYKARDRLLDEVVALKVLRPDATGSDEMARRFRSEIRLARAVSHRNVGRIHEYGEEGTLRYVSMAFVDGVDLRRLLLQRGRFSGPETASLTGQVAEALEAIHQEGIVHRDLKPGNVMIDGRGVARVMDFGIAKHWDNAAATAMTGIGQIIGTPSYMSPEQIRGEQLDGRSDLYSLGVVVYELATGRVPFRGNTPLATLYKHVHEPPALRGPEAEFLPPPLVPVLERALAKDREQRFATAREMADALMRAGQACAGEIPPATGTIASGALAITATPAVTASPPATAAPGQGTTSARLAAASPGIAMVPVTEVALPRTAAAPVQRRSRAWYLALVPVVGTAIAVVVSRPQPSGPSPAPTGVAASVVSVPPPSLASESSPTTVRPVLPAPAASSAAVVSAPVAPPPVTRAASSPRPVAADISGAAAIAGLLAEADAALADHATELAGSLYDQVLAIDPTHERARAGRARVAEALARGPAVAAARARFVAGQTRLDSAPVRSGPAGFESSAGIAVRPVEQAQSPGAKIYFEVTPAAVAPGDRYSVRAYLVNESEAAVDVGDVVVSTAVNGRRTGGRLDARVRQLAPGQRALLLEAQEVWRAETASWAMTITVRTPGGETYTNQLTWE